MVENFKAKVGTVEDKTGKVKGDADFVLYPYQHIKPLFFDATKVVKLRKGKKNLGETGDISYTPLVINFKHGVKTGTALVIGLGID